MSDKLKLFIFTPRNEFDDDLPGAVVASSLEVAMVVYQRNLDHMHNDKTMDDVEVSEAELVEGLIIEPIGYECSGLYAGEQWYSEQKDKMT